MSASKFAAFVAEKKINLERLRAVSFKLEGLQAEDRKVKLEKRTAKAKEGGEKKEFKKPRSGRPITPRALAAAASGGTVSGPTKQRILRAVNYLLEQKKQAAVELKTLF